MLEEPRRVLPGDNVESRRFDKLTCAVGRLERRKVLALLPATLAATLVGTEVKAADRKNRKKRARKRRKRNSVLCLSDGNRVIRCQGTGACCDSDRSNALGCARPGYTTCCKGPLGYNRLYSNDYRCCPSLSEGMDGACPDSHPLCCPGRCCNGSTCEQPQECWQLA